MVVNEDEYLEHFGVLGMKWGQHLFGKADSRATYKSTTDKPSKNGSTNLPEGSGGGGGGGGDEDSEENIENEVNEMKETEVNDALKRYCEQRGINFDKKYGQMDLETRKSYLADIRVTAKRQGKTDPTAAPKLSQEEAKKAEYDRLTEAGKKQAAAVRKANGTTESEVVSVVKDGKPQYSVRTTDKDGRVGNTYFDSKGEADYYQKTGKTMTKLSSKEAESRMAGTEKKTSVPVASMDEYQKMKQEKAKTVSVGKKSNTSSAFKVASMDEYNKMKQKKETEAARKRSDEQELRDLQNMELAERSRQDAEAARKKLQQQAAKKATEAARKRSDEQELKDLREMEKAEKAQAAKKASPAVYPSIQEKRKAQQDKVKADDMERQLNVLYKSGVKTPSTTAAARNVQEKKAADEVRKKQQMNGSAAAMDRQLNTLKNAGVDTPATRASAARVQERTQQAYSARQREAAEKSKKVNYSTYSDTELRAAYSAASRGTGVPSVALMQEYKKRFKNTGAR